MLWYVTQDPMTLVEDDTGDDARKQVTQIICTKPTNALRSNN